MGTQERGERDDEEAGVRRSLRDDELERLSRSSLFRGVSPEAMRAALQPAGELTLKSGGVLLEAGQRFAAIYILLAGRLALYANDDARIALAYVEPGECIGETAVIGDDAASPAIVAVANSHLLLLNPTDLWTLSETQPQLAHNLLSIMATRARCVRAAHVQAEAQAAPPLVHTDALTGLHNRRWMGEMFVRTLDRCERAGRPVSAALIDLDRFRSVNDNYGQRAGDRVLAQVAWVMQRQLRPADLVVRYGGEEFAVLLPQTALADAVAALERLRLAIGACHTALAQRATVRISVSVGVVQWQCGWSLEEMLHGAHRALEQAKQSGRNRVVAFGESIERSP